LWKRSGAKMGMMHAKTERRAVADAMPAAEYGKKASTMLRWDGCQLAIHSRVGK
jgi:hypothetical protein